MIKLVGKIPSTPFIIYIDCSVEILIAIIAASAIATLFLETAVVMYGIGKLDTILMVLFFTVYTHPIVTAIITAIPRLR